ncbi:MULTISPECIES: hypothetical protein [unclassified Bradyrhizobium]|uniref:ORC-CDC6 family AAA ATPase n=1 Tax=unclassified Bradyrhizobium TaxID=2631580 RepID=UPI001FF869FA|nr:MULTISPECIES: hypothetical protein [unclassified Bradyrhizobium]MCK1348622.1 hypothetical protein [Bradyrhizobium sp. CW11]MCK1506959.1 hypothetical protein [Bradyrhizobium sp. 18]
MLKKTNPFNITKAVDLSTEEIESLWIDVAGGDADAVFKPTSRMPLLILGGKGSGKTHWMRYYSFPLQLFRFQKRKVRPLEGLRKDGYIGIYVLLGGLNFERFRGRGQSDEIWRGLFEYYFELWLTQEIIQTLCSIKSADLDLANYEPIICTSVQKLFSDGPAVPLLTFKDLLEWCASLQQDLDYDINNVLYTGSFTTRVRATRGTLIFGIPKLLSEIVEEFREVTFSYQLDELENITEGQQRYVQSLIRERKAPATFRIGSRLYGIKTLETYSDDEANRDGSEFEQIVLDHRLRQNSDQWDTFADEIVRRRLQVFGALAERSISIRTIEQIFENPDLSWDSEAVFKMIGSPSPGTGRHFDRLKRSLKEGLSQGRAPGISSQDDIEYVAKAVALPGFPILEKINMLTLYQGWYRNRSLPKLADQIAAQAADFTTGRTKGAYATRVQHYASDMVAQLLRDEGKRIPLQFGLKNFIRMAEGLPRTLVVALRNIWDLAIYNEREEVIDHISTEDQANGLLDTAEWFMQTMRKPGADGTAVRTAIERIARLFETNRFADKPVECSLLGFSVLERELTEKTQSLLLVAEQRSFLIRTTKEEIDRNSQERLAKFQLNATLAPKWSLPIARRGIVKFSPTALDLIFDPARADEFEEYHKAWKAKMTAPQFGGPRKQEAHQTMPSLFEPDE